MSVLVETVHAFVARYPDAVGAWFILCAFPLISCVIWTALYFSRLGSPVGSFFRALAHSYGYPTALLGLVIVPVSAFMIFLAPALLDGYPAWQSALLFVFAIPNWFAEQMYWLAPAIWLPWVILAPRHAIRSHSVLK